MVRDFTYGEYLASDHWHALVRRYISHNPKARCFVCGNPWRLQLHHVSYKHLFHEKMKRDLYIVCGPCHRKQHFGIFGKKPLKHLRRRIWLARLWHDAITMLYDMATVGRQSPA